MTKEKKKPQKNKKKLFFLNPLNLAFYHFIFMKPDTIDQDTNIVMNKPDEKDSPVIYDKPNVYEEEEEHDSYRTSLPQEVIDDLIVRAEFINGKRPDVRTNEDEDTPSAKLTSSLLSHTPSSTTVLTTPPPVTVSPSISSASSNGSNSTASTSTTRLALLQILKKKPMEDMLTFDIRKTSLVRPFEHDIYFKGTKKLAYKKIQPHSYSWGFQNVLYRQSLSASDERNKVAEARRRAFKKQITIEWGDFPVTLNSSEFQEDDDSSSFMEDSTISFSTTSGATTTKSNQLLNRTKSHLLFTYDTEFEGFKIRWKRASLLSHDMICELKPDQHLEDHDAPKKQWRVIAEFDSHRMGYFIHLGELIIDKNALNLVERPDHLESHIIITCCTLIDLMREVVEKAVGLNKGGVVGSD